MLPRSLAPIRLFLALSLSLLFYFILFSLFLNSGFVCVHRAKKMYTRSFIHSIRNSDYYYLLKNEVEWNETPLEKYAFFIMLPKRNREDGEEEEVHKKLYNIIFHFMYNVLRRRHHPARRSLISPSSLSSITMAFIPLIAVSIFSSYLVLFFCRSFVHSFILCNLLSQDITSHFLPIFLLLLLLT